jgi:hypothetical protein
MLNILKTSSVLVCAQATDWLTISHPTNENHPFRADIPAAREAVPVKVNRDEKLEYVMEHEGDQEYGAVFTGGNYNFFPMAFDTTIAEVVGHDTYTRKVNGLKKETIDLKPGFSLEAKKYNDTLCLNQTKGIETRTAETG